MTYAPIQPRRNLATTLARSSAVTADPFGQGLRHFACPRTTRPVDEPLPKINSLYEVHTSVWPNRGDPPGVVRDAGGIEYQLSGQRSECLEPVLVVAFVVLVHPGEDPSKRAISRWNLLFIREHVLWDKGSAHAARFSERGPSCVQCRQERGAPSSALGSEMVGSRRSSSQSMLRYSSPLVSSSPRNKTQSKA